MESNGDSDSESIKYDTIYNTQTKQYITKVITVKSKDRQNGKDAIINFIVDELMNLLSIN